MDAIHGRALKIGGLCLFLFVTLFALTLNQAHAYPAPKFISALVYSSHNTDGSTTTEFYSRISGPSPEDVASFTATGPSGTFELKSGSSFREYGLYYYVGEGSIIGNGTYTFQVTDNTGRSATIDRDFAYNGTLPQVDSATMIPGNGAYIGTTTPTLSFDPVAGTVYYQLLIWDYDYKAIWSASPTTTATSFTVPAGLLQPNTAYRWDVRVWDNDSDRQNRHISNRLSFYTGTKGDPELNAGGVISLPMGENLLNYAWARGINVAPWDITYFRVTGPDAAVYNLANSRGYGFQFPAYNNVGVYLDPPTQSTPDGVYTVDIADTSGNTDSRAINYAYNPVPDFSTDSRVPADNAYFDTLTPSFSWARVTGDPGDGSYRYSVRITDYTTGIRWYDSPYSGETSFTLPTGLNLPTGSSYKWRVNVYGPAGIGGTNSNNFRCSDFRTFTINEPVIPALDIKANGSDGPIVVPPGTPVSITISLDPESKAGQNADWWIAVKTPFDQPLDWYTYVYPAGWQQGIKLCAQAGLFDLSSHEVLNMALPVGHYTFYFGIDEPDGTPAGPWWGMDSVAVTVQ